MDDILTTKQSHLSSFAYTTADLDALPKTMLDFGRNIIESLSKTKGGLNAIIAKDELTNEPVIVDYYRGSPELGEMPFRERVHRAAANYLERVFKDDCPQTIILKIDSCGDRDDLNIWDSLFIIEHLMLNDITIEGLGSFDDNPAVEMTGNFSLIQWERVIPIRFTEEAAELAEAPVRDIVFAKNKSCGNCGKYSNGCETLYAIADQLAGNDRLLYRIREGGAWQNGGVITPLGVNAAGQMAVVGRYLLSVSEAAGGHVYTLRPTRNGQTATWTLVTSGYDAGGAPRAIYAKSLSKIFIAGANGFIYRTDSFATGVEVAHDASLTTEDFNAIHGYGQVMVAVGTNDTILYSINEGVTYTEPDSTPNDGNITGVWVLSHHQWYVTTAGGGLWYTDDQGQSWSERGLPSGVTVTSIAHLAFAPESTQVGAMVVVTAGGSLVWRTVTGGRTWFIDSPGIGDQPDAVTISGLALCGLNQIVVAGTRTGGTAGIIAIAR